MIRANRARVGALAFTSVVLLATTPCENVRPRTCPSESGLVSGPVAFAVDTTCGAPGTAVMSADPKTCSFALQRADAVGLAAEGYIVDDGRTLEFYASDQQDCQADLVSPGEYAVRCYGELPQDGCGGGYVPVCDGTLRVVPLPP